MTFKLSAAALIAAATLISQPAMAADLGGDCCADLEERIAELEATTVRKGHRNVKLEISGWVNTSVLFWDDGEEQNIYVVDNIADRTRVRFRGSAKVNSDVEAGFLLEIGARRGRNDRVSADDDEGAGNGIDLRHSAWWLGSRTLGRVTVGQTSQSSDGITQISTVGINHAARSQVFDWNQNFGIRRSNGVQSGATWRNIASREAPGEGNRQNVVRYDTPTFSGFAASASWGEDDVWDVALRYAGEIQGFKLAAGISYTQWTDVDTGSNTGNTCTRQGPAAGSNAECQSLGLSASVLHTETGLYGIFAYGYHEDDRRAGGITNVAANLVDDRDEFYYFQGGLQRKWLPVGKTTVYGEYYRGNFGTSGGIAAGATTAPTINAGAGALISSEVDMWGFGINQSIEAAAMDFYVGYRNYEADLTTVNGAVGGVEGFQAVLTGAIIRF